jgi:hypothetical protein
MCAALLIAAIASAACGQSAAPSEQLNELARTRSGDLEVVLLASGTALNTGRDAFTIEFRAASDGRLADVGTVKASAMMLMTGMAPMFGPVDVEQSAVPGRYVATSELDMAGEWRLSVEWNGPASRGSATLSTSAQ